MADGRSADGDQQDLTAYLERLPDAARVVGDRARGEIELVTDPAEAARILADVTESHASGGRRDAGPAPRLGVVYEDAYILVVRDPVRFPNGSTGTYIRIIERSALDGVAGVVAVPVRRGRLLMRRSFRHALRRWELELPRGFRDAGRSVEDTVASEIREEVGVGIRSTRKIGTVAANSGLLAGEVDVFWVELEDGRPDPTPDPAEAGGRVVEIEVEEVWRRVAAGEIRDGFTLSALTLARAAGLPGSGA